MFIALTNELWNGCLWCEQFVYLYPIVYLALANELWERVCVV